MKSVYVLVVTALLLTACNTSNPKGPYDKSGVQMYGTLDVGYGYSSTKTTTKK